MERKVRCSDINRNLHEFLASELAFRPSIYGVVVRNGEVLLHSYADGYDFPGGGIDLGETLDEAFGREIQEETGLKVERGEPLEIISDLFIHPATNKPYHTILLYFAGRNPTGEISTDFFDEHEKTIAQAAKWIPIEDVASLKFFNPMTSAENAELVKKAVRFSA